MMHDIDDQFEDALHAHNAPAHVGTVCPLWRENRVEPPSRPIHHCHVWIDGRKAGRLDAPLTDDLDEYMLRELYPILSRGQHEVRVDFRAESGRGALGHIRIVVGSELESEGRPLVPDQAEVNSVGAMAGIVRNLMQSNERLSRMLIDSNEQNASTQITSHQELMQMMTMSLEREREAQRNFLEREEVGRRREAEREIARGDTSMHGMREMFGLMATMVESRAASGGGGGDTQMDTLKDYMAGQMLEKGMGMFEDAMSGNNQPKNPMAAVAEALAPILAKKLGVEPGEPPPEETPGA